MYNICKKVGHLSAVCFNKKKSFANNIQSLDVNVNEDKN